MRLTCPNCGAQYEVPDEVIPFDGRDVQCSNCGDTWFQGHPDNPDTLFDPEMDATSDPEPESEPEPEVGPEIEREVEPEPETEPEDKADAVPETDSFEDDPEDAARDQASDQANDQANDQDDAQTDRPQQAVDAGISDILRQEAERETQLRAGDAGSALESQPDLGLDQLGEDPSQRAQEAQNRMARIRGETATPEPGSRRDLLPDIEEINSAWSAKDSSATGTEVGTKIAEQPQQKRGSFVRGFAFVVIIGALLAMLYANAPKIADMIPMAEPALNWYVALVDQARLWLDARLGAMGPISPSE